jgi:hypothetical protein
MICEVTKVSLHAEQFKDRTNNDASTPEDSMIQGQPPDPQASMMVKPATRLSIIPAKTGGVWKLTVRARHRCNSPHISMALRQHTPLEITPLASPAKVSRTSMYIILQFKTKPGEITWTTT